MPHVYVDARLVSQAGIGTFLKSTLAAFASAPYDITLLCREEDRQRLAPYASQLLPMRGALYSIKEQLEYVQKIPTCDLFWAPHFNVPLMPIRAKKRITVISDVYHLAHFASLNIKQKIYAKLVYNAAFCLSDHVVTISEFSKREILKFASIAPKQLNVISPPLDFEPPSLALQKENYMLYVGNLKPHKNLARLVKAYAMLRPQADLLIVGKKEGLLTIDEQLFIEVERDPFLKGHVQFTGYVNDQRLKDLYAHAVLFLFPSTYEGFGYPPLEAMACGCPVLAAKAASIPEVCQDAVEYVDPFSIESIAVGMQRLLCDEKRREELVRKGKALVEAKKQQKNQIAEFIDACCNCT
jgi:glycosyltransferase involved in cell wall biosynthesis